MELLKHNPVKEIRRLKNSRHRDRLISPSEYEQILSALGYVEGQPVGMKMQKVAVMFQLAIETALRQSELTGLTKGTVFLDKRFVVLLDIKNDDREVFRFHGEPLNCWRWLSQKRVTIKEADI